MLFRCTENPPEKAISPPAALRVSAVAFSYTENSSFPYTWKGINFCLDGPSLARCFFLATARY